MSLFTRTVDNIAATFGYIKGRKPKMPAWLRATAFSERFDVPDGSLLANQAELYQRLTWVQIAISHVARTAAQPKFNVVRLKDEKSEEITNHDFERLLAKPNPFYSRFELLVEFYSYYLLTGNGYLFLNRRNKHHAPIELWPIPPQKIEPVPDDIGKDYLKGYLYYPDGIRVPAAGIPLESWEVLHLKLFHPLNTWVGLSPIEALATDATSEMEMSKWQANFFGKDYAKPAGAMAFADAIPDPIWERMKRDIKERHGGSKRQTMMLRNVGKGGLQWLNMAISQHDMQFLESRTFIKEEIFDLFAPGLSSMLSINSTEANSVIGKATFNEIAVWPHCVALAEKITNDILPIYVYDGDLQGAFEDIRLEDRGMKLQEQSAAEKVLTINELRDEYYGLPPLTNGRGGLLIAQIPSFTDKSEDEEAQKEEVEEIQEPKESVEPEEPEEPEEPKEPEEAETPVPATKARISALKADHDSAIVALWIKEPAIVRALFQAQQVFEATDHIQPVWYDEFHVTLAYIDSGIDDEALEKLNKTIALFSTGQDLIRGKLGGIGRFMNGDDFEPLYVIFDSPDVAWLRLNLETFLSEWGFSASNHHGFSPHITLGYIFKKNRTPDIRIDQLEFTINELTVASYGRQRQSHELTTKDDWSIKADLSDMSDLERRIYDVLMANFDKNIRQLRMTSRRIVDGDVVNWSELDEDIKEQLLPILEEAFSSGFISLDLADLAASQVDIPIIPIDELKRQWARTYSGELLQALNGTTATLIQKTSNAYSRGEIKTIGEVTAKLMSAFKPTRAEAVAITEVTRAAAHGVNETQTYLKSQGIQMERVARTNNDSLVCKFCRPFNGLPESEWPNAVGPPWHVRCRCMISLRMPIDAEEDLLLAA